uniref:Uncharacterized protein n=1 Tax=Cacopsylla melanoneura TaxID=428564 RepID=A0A8D8VMI7_9HEMI
MCCIIICPMTTWIVLDTLDKFAMSFEFLFGNMLHFRIFSVLGSFGLLGPNCERKKSKIGRIFFLWISIAYVLKRRAYKENTIRRVVAPPEAVKRMCPPGGCFGVGFSGRLGV